VLQAFGADPSDPDRQRFVPRARADGSPRWLANLQQLALDRLQAAGISAGHIGADRRCTVEAASDFFSFRREGVTGRMAALVWRSR
jgi:copper oxidase (laccase) domain-containing protein